MSAILLAWAECVASNRSIYEYDRRDEEMPDDKYEELSAAGAAAEKIIIATAALTPTEHAAKLRVVLLIKDQSRDNAKLILGLTDLIDDLEDEAVLPDGDGSDQLIWDTIRALEAAAGR